MQRSSESISTTDELNTQKALQDCKDKALDLLNKESVSENDITKVSMSLRKHPLLSIEVKEELLNEKPFEMLNLSDINPIFTLNLLNVIMIVNFVWNATKKNIDLFHKILLDLNLMFSYVLKNNDGEIGFALLATVPVHFYELIAEKGKKCFKGDYSFNNEFLSFDRNIAQIGLVYQENTIVQLNSMLNEKQTEAPNIMYFLCKEICTELYEKSVFNLPKNFLDLEYKLDFCDYGIKEIDYSFILTDDIKIQENLIFNKVFENSQTSYFINTNSNESVLTLNKDTNIFVEIKSKLESKDAITKLIDTSDLFSQAYTNLAFDSIEQKFSKQKIEYYLLYDTKRNDAFPILQKLEKEDQKIKNTKVVYNSGYVQIASIVSLQNQIREMNDKMDKMKGEMKEREENIQNSLKQEKNKMSQEMKNSLEQEKNKMKEEMNKEMEIRMKKIENKMSINQKVFEFKLQHKIDLKTIQDKLVNIKGVKDLLKFASMNVYYTNLCKKILEIDNDNNIIMTADKVIGKFLKSQDEIKEVFNLISLLDKKISEKKFVAPYYEAFKSILTGPNWNSKFTPKNFKCFDAFSKNNFKEIIVKILKYIVVLEYDEELENNFFEAILYYVYNISQTDISCYNLFYIYYNKDDLRATVSKFIKSLNEKNHDLLNK